jgi:hypothetical protein
MTKNRAAYYQYINEPFFFVFFPLFPGIAGVGSRNDESLYPVIANEVKQSTHRPCNTDGYQAAACAWIASSFLLAISSLYATSFANEVKQSTHRPCSPDGCQTAACAWIASSFLLAMTSLYAPSLRTK